MMDRAMYKPPIHSVALTDEKKPAFLRSHEDALEFLGGAPHEIVYDKIRSIVLGVSGHAILTPCGH